MTYLSIPLRALLGIALAFCLFCLLGLPGPAHAADAAPASSALSSLPEHQVLVMLHLPSAHYRPDASYGGHYTGDIGHAARRRIALELAQAHGLTLMNDWPMPVLGIDCYVLGDPSGDSAAHLAEVLSRDPRAEWVQPMSLYHGLGNGLGNGLANSVANEQGHAQDDGSGSNDPLYAVQPAAKFWHLEELHHIATGRNVRVAVVDSGIEEGHPDLRGQVAVRENFVDNSPYAAEAHGTAVAGIIAALAGNGVGIEGVAPGARLMALRACWQAVDEAASCNSFTLGKALNFAITHDAQIINLSLGGPPDRLLQRLLEVAQQRGIKLVAAVDSQRADGGFPASVPGVLAVAGLEPGAIGASGGSIVGVLHAPGRDIPTTTPGARWSLVSGSSYAAAHVSGMVALLMELRPELNAAQLRELMVATAQPGASGGIDACATIGRITGNCSCSCATAHASTSSHPP